MVVAPFPWHEETYTVDGKEYSVHPVAKLFPLIVGDEFERLVDDVRAHGLRRPILITGETMIVDGRNRLRAALEADVPPVFEPLPPDASLFSVIVSENVLRRQMNKGQLAMVAALIRQMHAASADRGHVRLLLGGPALTDAVETAGQEGGADVGGRASEAMARLPTQEELAASLSVSVAYVRQAERVLESKPDLAMQVSRGEQVLSAAYELCKPTAKPVGNVDGSSETATGDGIAQRTVQRRKSEEPGGSAATAIESTSDGVDRQNTEVPSTNGKGAAQPMPLPSGDESSQPAPTVTAAESKPRPDEAELMTPRVVLDAVRLILSDIDLDPCSSEAAQKRVAADEWYSVAQDGLSRPWHGNVHVFPPAERVDAFAQKLTAEMTRGNVQRAAFLGPADLRPDWAARLLQAPTFRALVVERDERRVEAVGDRTQEGRLALFLLGVETGRLPDVLDTWGVTVFSARPDGSHGAVASAARTVTEGRNPQADSSRMSTVRPSAPTHSKSDRQGGWSHGQCGRRVEL